MPITYKTPKTAEQWQAYYELRWQILRAPWQQPRGSERDELEDAAYHVMAVDEDGQVVGVGRLHQLNKDRAQIRYMAVAPQYQRQGIGTGILFKLEQQALEWGCKNIMLNARTESLQFYQMHNYVIEGDALALFNAIAHKMMSKVLR